MARRTADMAKLAEAHEALQAAVDVLAEAVVTVDETGEPMKRVTIAVPESLHDKIKRSCLDWRINMADAMLDVLAQAPWPTRETL